MDDFGPSRAKNNDAVYRNNINDGIAGSTQADLKPGEEGRVVFITPKSRGCLERLSALGLNPDRW